MGWSDRAPLQSYDIAVVIGRFQPLHNAHVELIKLAQYCAKHVLVLVGSSDIARNIRNPFTFDERRQMIGEVFPDVIVSKLVDCLYNDQLWIAQVQSAVEKVAEVFSCINPRICLVGHKKDQTSYYLNMFPKYKLEETERFVQSPDGTGLRQAMFEDGCDNHVFDSYVPWPVRSFLQTFGRTTTYATLKTEHDYIKKYKKQFEGLAYPPIFNTVDAVVICSGNILLVKRRSHPGKGLWAMPGGFLNAGERIVDGIIRELYEETKINVNEKLLRASIKDLHVFDAVGRSLRGRTITHAGLIVLNQRDLPSIRGSDDAEKAVWLPISEFWSIPEKLFEDHHSVIQYMINRAN